MPLTAASSLLLSPLPLPLSSQNAPPHLLLRLHRGTASLSLAAASSERSSSAVTSPPATMWTVDSWKSKKALQLPEYPDEGELEAVLKTLDSFPPIVFAGEARRLEERLAEAAMGRAFLLQGGDCAESFKEFNANNIRDTFRVLLQMAAVLMFGGQVPVIKVREKSLIESI